MTYRRPAALFLSALLCALAAAPALALNTERLSRVAPSSAMGPRSLQVVSGIAFVSILPGISTSTAESVLGQAGFSLDTSRSYGAWRPVYFQKNISVSQALATLKGLSSVVEKAEPDKVYAVKRVPGDPYVPVQYALSRVQAFGAWEYETGSSTVTVAVIDTGVETTHPEFAGKFADSTSQFCDPGPSGGFLDNSPCVAETSLVPACYHGTAVAGVAAAAGDNSVGISGMSWGARLVSLRVFRTIDCTPDCLSSTCSTDDKAMADAFSFLASKQNTPAYGKIVANLSLGCPVGPGLDQCGTCDPLSPVGVAIANAVSAGVMIFAAAGNSGSEFLDTPGDCPGVIPVGATDQQDNLAFFSNTDSTMTTRGLSAPGVDVYTTTLSSGYASVSGTSFASPMAAGLAALVWSAKPTYTASDVFDKMKNSVDDLGPAGPDRSFGWGRINAMKALRLAATGTTRFAGTNKAVAYPNPFRPQVHRLVTFTVPQEMSASGLEVKVYTTEGELVRKLDGSSWDGKNDSGAPVASGVYIFRVKTDKDSAVGKMALVR